MGQLAKYDTDNDWTSSEPSGRIVSTIIEDDYFHEKVAERAPDDGYGWIIVFASFICNLIVDGIMFSFGLFFVIFILHFGSHKSKVALYGALLNSCYQIVGKSGGCSTTLERLI